MDGRLPRKETATNCHVLEAFFCGERIRGCWKKRKSVDEFSVSSSKFPTYVFKVKVSEFHWFSIAP